MFKNILKKINTEIFVVKTSTRSGGEVVFVTTDEERVKKVMENGWNHTESRKVTQFYALWWVIQMAYYLKKMGYYSSYAECAHESMSGSWMDYFMSGCTPKEAIEEDLSCG